MLQTSTRRILALYILSVLACVGCRGAHIDGKVVDGVTGKGLPNVQISVVGTSFQAASQSDGTYSVPFVPGRVTVRFEAAGYTTDSLQAEITAAKRYPAADIRLWQIPSEPGFWITSDTSYIHVPTFLICSFHTQEQRSLFIITYRHFTTGVDLSTAPKIHEGGVGVVIYRMGPWRLFSVPSGRKGEFAIMEQDMYLPTYSGLPIATVIEPNHREDIGPDLEFVSFNLSPGVYLFANLKSEQSVGYEFVVGTPQGDGDDNCFEGE